MALHIVNSAADTIDAGDGVLTLREALALTNAGSGGDTITFDPTVFNGQPQDIIRLTQGELMISQQVTIDGDINDDFRPDITISGDALGNDIIDQSGITDVKRSQEAVGLLLDNTPVLNIDMNNGSQKIDGLIITGGHGGNGGGISTQGFDWLSALVITNSNIAGNKAVGSGGGVRSSSLTLINNTQISDNIIDVNGTVNISGGGGLHAGAGAYIVNSTISGNEVTNHTARGGGVYAGWIEIYNTTISDNILYGTSENSGGGTYSRYNQLNVMVNSTVTGNAIPSGGGAAGVYVPNGGIQIINSIILGNYSPFSSGGG